MYDYQRGMQGVQKHNMQISSGLKIQNSFENASIYNDAMRLDYEITSLDQVVTATSKSQNFAKNSDKSLQEFSKQLENFKVKLVQAASDVHNTTSLGAIANDLEGIKDHLMNIANTSLNGQFLFSGSAVDTKPISQNGSYNGNKEQMRTIAGSKVEIPYNLNGYDLFLGKDDDYNKVLTTNVKLTDNTRQDPDAPEKILTEESKIKHLVGLDYVQNKASLNSDYDFLDNSDVKYPDTYFYMQGKKSDGTSFTSKFKLTADTTIRGLMDKIGIEFGNTTRTKVVDVNINNDGQIVVKDLTKGAQVLDFSLVGATEKVLNRNLINNTNANPPSSVSSLADLENAANPAVAIPAGKLPVHITTFTKNKYTDINGEVVNPFDYDKVQFSAKDNTLSSNVSQVVRKTGEYATENTRLSEVAGTRAVQKTINGQLQYVKNTYDVNFYPKGIDPKDHDLYNIDNQTISMKVKSKLGTTYEIDVKMGTHNPNAPVSFSIKGTNADGTPTYPGYANQTRTLTVYNADEHGEYRTRTPDFSYRQLMDIVAMAASDNIPNPPHAEGNFTPAGGGVAVSIDSDHPEAIEKRRQNYEAYKTAIDKSKGAIEVNLNHRGQIELTDKMSSVTNVELTMYDKANNGGQFLGDSTGTTATTRQGNGSVFSFMENNAIAIDEPSIDLFSDLTKMIEAVRNGYFRTEADSADPRNTGIQGGIERIDHLMDHINKEKVKIGSYTNLLEDTNNRARLMKVNVESVKSDVINADYAESYLSLMQNMMSYQAMLQATSKINQLSLLNYM